MYLLNGNFYVERNDRESGIQSFERARARLQHHPSQSLLLVSLVNVRDIATYR